MNIEDTMKTYMDILEAKYPNNKIVFMGLYGSQNYSLSDNNSDVDVRAVIMPNIEDLVKGKTISNTIETPRGNIDVKDVMSYFKIIKKGNPAFIEPLLSEWRIYDSGNTHEIYLIFRKIAVFQPVNYQAMYGMMHQKLKRYKKEQDPKDAHHIIRLANAIISEQVFEDFDDTEEYSEEYKQMMMEIKRGKKVISVEELEELVEQMRDAVNSADKFAADHDHDDEIVKEVIKVIKEEASNE